MSGAAAAGERVEGSSPEGARLSETPWGGAGGEQRGRP